jgi:hypothetical protein
VLLFLARVSFAAEESWPTCGDGEEITLSIESLDIDLQAVDTYDWTFSDVFYEWGGELLDTTGPTATIRCPHCVDGESRRWEFQVELSGEDQQYHKWAYGYFNHECHGVPIHDDRGCSHGGAGGSASLALLALTFRRRRS